MATALKVSSAYLSALEHGRRGTPTWDLLQRIIAYFNVIWDEAEELIRLSRNLRSAGRPSTPPACAPEATALANRLARDIGRSRPQKTSSLSRRKSSDGAGKTK